MKPYILALCVHVVVAILGLGQIAGMLVVARRADGPVAATTWTTLEDLVRGTTWSLGLLLVTGALVEYLAGVPFHETWWFRISFGLLLVIGAINGVTRRALRKRDKTQDAAVLARVRRGAWAMCAGVATVAVLMEAKPW